MENLIKKYLSLIDDILVDFLSDIKSLRYQLVLAAFALNVYLFQHGAAPSVMLASIGLLTLVYGLYFQSKKHQAEMEAKMPAADEEPSVERDPEA
jgi:phosphate starvation-inducible membrane PsiE